MKHELSKEQVSNQQISDLITRLNMLINGYPDLTVQAEKLTVAALLELQQARALLAAHEQEPVAVVELSDFVTAAQLSGDEPRKKAVRELYEGALVIGQNLYANPAPSIPTVSFYRDGIAAAAAWVDAQREAYDNEHGRHDPDTGTFEFGNDAQLEYSSTLVEIAEGIRALHPNASNAPSIPAAVPEEITQANAPEVHEIVEGV